MDTANSQYLSKIYRMLLAGIGVAFAWVLLSFALGLTASPAHAGEDGGLLGDLTSTVEETVTAVVEPAAPVVQAVVEPITPVVESVAPVVQQVTQPAPVLPLPPVAEVVETVVAPLTNTVTEVADSGVVTPIVDSTVALVDTIPVVNEVVSTFGIDTAAGSLGSSVDGLLQGTAGAATGTVTGVTGTVSDAVDSAAGIVTDTATSPGLPVVAPLIASDGVVESTVVGMKTDAEATAFEMLARTSYMAAATALLTLAPELPSAMSPAGEATAVAGVAAADITFALLRSVLQADSAFVGPSGAGPGAWVLVALGFVIAYRAWVRRSGPENDVAPAAPVLSTDVSPD